MSREKLLSLFESVVDDPEYQQSLLGRAREGTLPPEVEELILHTAMREPPSSTTHQHHKTNGSVRPFLKEVE